MKSNRLFVFVAGLCYASTIAVIDYFKKEPFDLKKFVVGAIFFTLAMIIARKINTRSKTKNHKS